MHSITYKSLRVDKKKVFLFGQHVIPELTMMKKLYFNGMLKINMNDENLHNNNVVQIVII